MTTVSLAAAPSDRPAQPGVLTLDEVMEGLFNTPPQLPAKAFYDERGAALFEEITRLDEYYPTRAEREILSAQASDISSAIGQGGIVIEYGSGAADKSRLLFPQLRPSAYVPVDVSAEQLRRVAHEVEQQYPGMLVRPVVADFTDTVELPPAIAALHRRRVALFLGSTIGNFHPPDAIAFLQRVRHTIGSEGVLLLGADLRKDSTVLHNAYNDARGVTAEFNVNVLERLRREFGAAIDVDAFAHYAFYEPVRGRIEMHLVAKRPTHIDIAGRRAKFAAGEGIWTESSYKFTHQALTHMGAEAGFSLSNLWTDPRGWFSLALFVPQQ